MTRIAIVGSREFKDATLMRRVVERLVQTHGEFTLVRGGAKGADTLAQFACAAAGLPKPIIFLPNREKAKQAFGSSFRDRAFGRNKWIVDHADICVAFFVGKTMTGGTLNTVNHARRKGITIYAYYVATESWETIPATVTTGL